MANNMKVFAKNPEHATQITDDSVCVVPTQERKTIVYCEKQEF
jgi:hypothetical protein